MATAPIVPFVAVSPAGLSIIQHETLAEIQEALGVDAIDIEGATELASIADDDLMLIYDTSASAWKSVTLADLKTYFTS